MSRRTRISFAIAAVAVAAGSAVFAYLQRDFLAHSGLRAAYRMSPAWDGDPAFTDPHEAVSIDVIRRHVPVGSPVSVVWQGYLLVPETARYRFAVDVDDVLQLDIDRQRVLDLAATGSAASTVVLNRGAHPIAIRYLDRGDARKLSLYWARERDALTPLPLDLLVPEIVSSQEVRLRRALAWGMPIVPLCGSVLLLAAAAAIGFTAFRPWLPRERASARRLGLIVCVAAALFAIGAWWGLPDYEGWAPDELWPVAVRGAVDAHFRHGWAAIYPPLHFAILGFFSAPFHIGEALGAVALEDVRVTTAMFAVYRIVSVMMGVGVVLIVWRIGSRFSDRAGLLSAAFTICIMPLAYYAKLANVDLPCVFWLALSAAFYLRALDSGAARDFLLFVVFGTAAIATKDQAYGFFALPALAIIVAAVRHRGAAVPPGVPSMRVLGLMVATAVAGLLVGYNVLPNPDGFRNHVEFITGAGSAPYRMYDRSAGGQLAMAADAALELARGMSWPLFALALAGGIAAWRAHVTPLRALLLAIVSYYLTVIVVIGYHYDRFFLAPAVALAIVAAWAADAWLARRSPGVVRASTALLAAAACYALLRVAALDAIMVRDSRAVAEAWLVEHTQPGARIGAAGQYLPRRAKIFWIPLAQDLDELARVQPDYVLVNASFNLRQEPGSRRADFYDALSSGRTPYRRVFQYRSRPAWSPLNLETRFSDPREDPHSNLSKINPLIEVYAR